MPYILQIWLKFFKNEQNPTEAPQRGVKDHILFMLPPLAKNWPNQVEEINIDCSFTEEIYVILSR